MSATTDTEQSSPMGPEQGAALIDTIMAAAQPGAVFGAPVAAGDSIIITASEVAGGGGFGFGQGHAPEAGTGGGGGGGGGAMGRPVAVIIIGPTGARVEPIVDVTKIALAGITA